MVAQSEQLMLPVPIREKQSVDWYIVEQAPKRKFLFWKELVYRAIWKDESDYTLARVKVNVNDIDKLEDADLRYALRFEAVADSMGMIADSPWSSHGHFVTVHATAGTPEAQFMDAKFAYASYTGVTMKGRDTFMEDIHSFAPTDNEDH